MYKQFNKERRIELAILRRVKKTPLECAVLLGMNKSSVTRELTRYSDSDKPYSGAKAHKKYLEKRKESKEQSKKINNDKKLKAYIKRRLMKRDSPEQIAGRIKIDKIYKSVCHETIYQWVFTEKPEYKKCLRRISHKDGYRRKRGTKIRIELRKQGQIKRIDTRPLVVETRERLGDFEGDTIIGSDRTKRLLTNVDRRSGYGMINKLNIVNTSLVQEKLQKRFEKIPKKKRHTYTYDNGVELGEQDPDLEKKIKMDIYRAYPYHSWERGSSENYNGLVRDFFPKGTDFAIVSEQEVLEVEKNLNHRPRKRLGFLTPYEVFIKDMEWCGSR
jgi:IS30 family transposase